MPAPRRRLPGLPGLPGAARRRGPTFLLGLGAHLAGMGVLHRYLAAAPECEPGPHREYHVLDSAGLPSEAWVRDLLLDRAQQGLDAARAGEPASGRALQRAAMIVDQEVYYDFFAGLLARPGTRLSLDLTPEHSLLDAAQLSAVREGFERRGVRPVAALVVRDPLDRLVTHVRLLQRERPETHPGPVEDVVAELHTDPAFEARTRYDLTLAALDGAFGRRERWVGFHEELTSPRSTQQLCRLLGIAHREPEPVPERPLTATAGLPQDLARQVVEHHRVVYETVADRLRVRRRRLEEVWPSATLLR